MQKVVPYPSHKGLGEIEGMVGALKGKDFLRIFDWDKQEIMQLLEFALNMKRVQKEGLPHSYLQGKVLGMIFDKPSTRTRVSFEVGMLQLGGNAIFLSSKDIQLGRGETIHDTAKVLSRYVDGIMIRTFEHGNVEQLAQHAEIPVINGLTDIHHPCQVVADLLTILEAKGTLQGLKLAYVGDGYNNMAHSLLEGATKVGMNIAIASPEGYEPDQEILQQARDMGKETGATVTVTYSPEEAVEQADVIVTDVWTSMGHEGEAEKRLAAFQGFQVNEQLCSKAKSDYIFLHCLPAHREEEVTSEIIDGPHSLVFDEAENRLHAQKAILAAVMG